MLLTSIIQRKLSERTKMSDDLLPILLPNVALNATRIGRKNDILLSKELREDNL